MGELELNLRLDENGRTTFDPEILNETSNIPQKLDYTSKVILSSLSSLHNQNSSSRDDLLFDCEVIYLCVEQQVLLSFLEVLNVLIHKGFC